MNANLSFLEHASESEFMLEINTTPLIDVMLVLLIMLIITIPLQLHAVKLELPVESAAVSTPQNIVRIDIDAGNVLSLDDTVIDDRGAFENSLKKFSSPEDYPNLVLHINVAAKSNYESLAFVLASAQRQGISRLNIVGIDRFKL
jgi:biopolymer transport protein ExbD